MEKQRRYHTDLLDDAIRHDFTSSDTTGIKLFKMDSTLGHHLDLPPIDVSHYVKVTTVTAKPMAHSSPADTGSSRSLESSRFEEMKQLQRRTRTFTETDIKDFVAFLEQRMTETIGLVLV